jgi:mTERF
MLCFLAIVLLFAFQASSLVENRLNVLQKKRNGNHHARHVYDFVLSRVSDSPETIDENRKQWTKFRSYVYRSANDLSVGQVESVCSFLGSVFDRETVKHVLQTNPRIVRKTVSTYLEPTVAFLRELYGESLMQNAIRRNPRLLLTRGSGYDIDTLDLLPLYFTQDLNFTGASLEKLKSSAPLLFQSSASKVMKNSEFLKSTLLLSMSESSAERTLQKLILRYPTLLQLTHENLSDSFRFLQAAANLSAQEASLVVSRSPSVLGFSADNLRQNLNYLSCWLETDDLRKVLVKHSSILCLSLSNLESKVEYWNSIDEPGKHPRDTLAARVLRRAPSTFSLSLSSIRDKVDLLMCIWGPACADSRSKFASLLAEDPNVLTLSLERNMRPTIQFYNRTGYILLDIAWNRPPNASQGLLRPRFLSASLFQRLLPRWHFSLRRGCFRVPLHVLATSTDNEFCEFCGSNLTDYRAFVRQVGPRLRTSFQFDRWLQNEPSGYFRTDPPIDVSLSVRNP